MSEPFEVSIQIAGITFRFQSERPRGSISTRSIPQGFRTLLNPDVSIWSYYERDMPSVPPVERTIFDSETVWTLYQSGQKTIVAIASPITDSLPFCVASFDMDLRSGEVRSFVPDPDLLPDGLLPFPLDFPLSEVLLVCLLGQDRGLMVHACGISNQGQGYLFAGNSTHGKSTMAGLWQDQSVVLNDDRIILRFQDGRIWMYATPWHGDFPGVSSKGVPLDKIFFLRHAGRNSARPKSGVGASAMLLTRAFPPLWDEKGMQFTLDFCEQIVETVPCYELGFVPNSEVVDFVRCVD